MDLTRPISILLIEDHEEDMILLLKEISRQGYKVSCKRVETAIQMRNSLQNETHTYDIILSDYNLPSFNGLEALKIMKEIGVDLPFIIVSGAIGETTAVEVMKAGAHDYIMKNNLTRLVPAIEREIFEANQRKERRVFEKELLTEREKNQRIESIGLLAGGIAHDFNNILTVILGNISILKHDLKGENRKLATITEVEKGAMRAKDLTKQLLTFSKGGTPIKKIHSISEIIKEAGTFSLHGSKAKLTFKFPPNLWHVNVDKGQISQVIQNIIINAKQAMRDKFLIDTTATNENIKSNNVYNLEPGKYVKVIISDSGVGISTENLPKIFDLYFSTKTNGTGLGLPICMSILKKHGGTITAQSQLGEGTSFIFFIPANENGEIINKPRQHLTFKGKGSILILEDQKSVANTLKAMLKRFSLDSCITYDGTETLIKFSESITNKAPFQAVILDLTIPGGKGGIETMKELIKINPHVKVIVSSGYSTGEVMSNFEKFGFKGVLMKPYTISALGSVLKKLIGVNRNRFVFNSNR